MRAIRCLPFLLLVAFAVTGCEHDPGITDPSTLALEGPVVAAPRVDTDAVAVALVEAAGWALDPEREPAAGPTDLGRGAADLTLLTREVLAADVVHSVFEIRLGSGPFDVIRLHRVVREGRPGWPMRAREPIFLLHGSGVGFEGAFLPGPSDATANSLPVHLARNGVDVWGIDLGWTLIPIEQTDFSFVADWGLQRDLDDLRVGLAVARGARILSGNGTERFNLMGWSSGVAKVYMYAAQEARRPRLQRHVKTLIPVDSPFLSSDPAVVQAACDAIDAITAERAGGVFVNSGGALAITAAQLAQFDPDGVSPIPGFAPLTNLQIVLLAQSLTASTLGGPVPYYHLFAGVLGESGLPVDFQFVSIATGIEFYASWSPYEPNSLRLQEAQIECPGGVDDLDFDFAAVEVPVLYVGAGGGYGTTGTEMEARLGSEDFRTLIVSTDPNPFFDFGHVDLFKAAEAEALFWDPVLAWIEEHARSKAGGRRNAVESAD